jgi:transposase-like protein
MTVLVSIPAQAELGGITPFFNPPEIPKAIYTTNSLESLNRSPCEIIKIQRVSQPRGGAELGCSWLFGRQ